MSIISEFQTFMQAFDFSFLLDIIKGVIPALFCITIHELCHGLAAYAMGDDTAKTEGRLTLNPVKHLDILGLLMMTVFHVGWAKPVPVNMYKFKNPKLGMALTALAGPMSNVLLSVVMLLLFGFLYIPLCSTELGMYVLSMVQLTAYISLGLAIFNLIPVPPLDGSKILFSCLSDESYEKLMIYERYFSLALVLLLVSGVLGDSLSTLISKLFYLLSGISGFGIKIMLNFM